MTELFLLLPSVIDFVRFGGRRIGRTAVLSPLADLIRRDKPTILSDFGLLRVYEFL